MQSSQVVIAESSVWINLLRNNETAQTAWLRGHLGKPGLCIVDLILCKVLQGAGDQRSFRQILTMLTRLPILDTGGVDLAMTSAENYQTLHKRGITIRSTIDCLLATFYMREGYALLHNDRDFDPFEEHLGLKVIHPPTFPIH